MTVKQLRAFLVVAQTLSFAQAGDRLCLSQSALSLTIKALEDTLGGRLFSRTTRSVRLTPEGEALVPLARRLLADWDDAEDELRQRFSLRRGRVAMAAMPSFAGNLLPSVLKRFRQQYPAIGVTVHDVLNEDVMELVRSGAVELGIAFEPEPSCPLLFNPLYVDRFVAVVPTDSLLATQPSLTWSELLTEPFITLQRPSGVRVMLEKHLHQTGLSLPVAFESHQLATVGRMVANCLGVSAVPALCQQQMRELGALCVPLEEPVIQRAVGMLTRPGHELSVAAKAIADIFVAAQIYPS